MLLGEKEEQDIQDNGALGGLSLAAEDQSVMFVEHPDGNHRFLLQSNAPDKEIHQAYYNVVEQDHCQFRILSILFSF